MRKKCPNCRLVNFSDSPECVRCSAELVEVAAALPASPVGGRILRRILIFAGVCFLTLFGFYLSLLLTSDPLGSDERAQIAGAIEVLEEKGFSDEVFLLRYVAALRRNDNWLNASTKTENAYAATNFPFEIMTVYPDFFEYPHDATERAAILLHEAKHLQGLDEKEAYEFVWKNRQRLGWTRAAYGRSPVWQNVRKQTREFAPDLFVCEFNDFADCTEN